MTEHFVKVSHKMRLTSGTEVELSRALRKIRGW